MMNPAIETAEKNFNQLMDEEKVFQQGSMKLEDSFEIGVFGERRLRGYKFFIDAITYKSICVNGHFEPEAAKKIAEALNIPYPANDTHNPLEPLKGKDAAAWVWPEDGGLYAINLYTAEAIKTLIRVIREEKITNKWAFGNE